MFELHLGRAFLFNQRDTYVLALRKERSVAPSIGHIAIMNGGSRELGHLARGRSEPVSYGPVTEFPETSSLRKEYAKISLHGQTPYRRERGGGEEKRAKGIGE